MEYVGNLCSPCPLHQQPKDEFIFLGSACTIQLRTCMPIILILEESILLATLMHVVYITIIYDKSK